MAEAPVAIPPDVLEAARPTEAAAPEAPIAGDDTASPAEEVSWFVSFLSVVPAPSVVRLCFVELQFSWFGCFGVSLTRFSLCNLRRVSLLELASSS